MSFIILNSIGSWKAQEWANCKRITGGYANTCNPLDPSSPSPRFTGLGMGPEMYSFIMYPARWVQGWETLQWKRDPQKKGGEIFKNNTKPLSHLRVPLAPRYLPPPVVTQVSWGRKKAINYCPNVLNEKIIWDYSFLILGLRVTSQNSL